MIMLNEFYVKKMYIEWNFFYNCLCQIKFREYSRVIENKYLEKFKNKCLPYFLKIQEVGSKHLRINNLLLQLS